MKKYIWIVSSVVVIGVALAGLGYYFFMQQRDQEDINAACIGTVFPLVVIEHSRNQLEELMDQPVGDNKEPKGHFYFSKGIDQKFIHLAETARSSQNNDALQDKMAEEFRQLIPVFHSESPQFLPECTLLFKKISDACDKFAEGSEDSKKCSQTFRPEIEQLLVKYIPTVDLNGSEDSDPENVSPVDEEEHIYETPEEAE